VIVMDVLHADEQKYCMCYSCHVLPVLSSHVPDQQRLPDTVRNRSVSGSGRRRNRRQNDAGIVSEA